MSKTLAIFKREMRSLFVSPLAWVIAAMFMLLSGYLFSLLLFATGAASMSGTFGTMSFILLFVCPLFTMRLLADERRNGTEELLMTSPIAPAHIVLGKFLAALALYAAMLALTLEFPLILSMIGKPDWGPIIGGYAGLLLMGAAFIAIGVFSSSLSDNQMIAGVTAFAILLMLWLVEMAGSGIGAGSTYVFEALSIPTHFEDFEKGVFDALHVYYYVAMTALFLFLTVKRLDAKKW